MSIVVFYIDNNSNKPEIEYFNDNELLAALGSAERLRKAGQYHVSISTQFLDNVGKVGVDSVENNLTPDGIEYDWVKRR